jgi:hypothetical protein
MWTEIVKMFAEFHCIGYQIAEKSSRPAVKYFINH